MLLLFTGQSIVLITIVSSIRTFKVLMFIFIAGETLTFIAVCVCRSAFQLITVTAVTFVLLLAAGRDGFIGWVDIRAFPMVTGRRVCVMIRCLFRARCRQDAEGQGHDKNNRQ
jgi:hypothetical protein